MKRLIDALRRVTLTHVLLAVIAIFLGLNWSEFVVMNKTLHFIEIDLTGPINVDVSH